MSKAISIRQPWAHLIIHAGKDVENRTWPTRVRGYVLIHAGKTMTREDYASCSIFCASLPHGALPESFWFPTFEELKSQCGGIVGEMIIEDCVRKSPSPWFFGPYGFTIGGTGELPFRPCKGELGFFNVDCVEAEL